MNHPSISSPNSGSTVQRMQLGPAFAHDVHVCVNIELDHDTAELVMPTPEQKERIVRTVAKVAEFNRRRYEPMKIGRYYGVIQHNGASVNTSCSSFEGPTYILDITFVLLGGPVVKRKLPALPPLRKATEQARAKVTAPLVLDPKKPCILVYNSYRVPYTEAFATRAKAVSAARTMQAGDDAIPLAVVCAGVMDYCYPDVLGRPSPKHWIRTVRMECEELGIRVVRVGVNLMRSPSRRGSGASITRNR